VFKFKSLSVLIIVLLFSFTGCGIKKSEPHTGKHFLYDHGAIVRGDSSRKEIALVFTGDEFGDGASFIADALKKEDIKASFFLTGNFYRNKQFEPVIKQLISDGNYLGSHSDRHLLYCDWSIRDSLLITKRQFMTDLANSFSELAKFGIKKSDARFYLPPYEWYNDPIALWTAESGMVLVNFTHGTKSNADYAYPEMQTGYADSKSIFDSIMGYEKISVSGLNGFILLVHIGTDPRRTDKFYFYLPELISRLKGEGYRFVRIDELLK
jgi:peptidoglycan/xylan/chitin deacetylase (PgdA/CDA1 family)